MSTVEADRPQHVGTDVPPSIAVVEAVAEREGVAPCAFEPTLNDVVDCDALDSLFADEVAAADASLTFSYGGYDVTVDGDGDVVVEA